MLDDEIAAAGTLLRFTRLGRIALAAVSLLVLFQGLTQAQASPGWRGWLELGDAPATAALWSAFWLAPPGRGPPLTSTLLPAMTIAAVLWFPLTPHRPA